MPKKEHQKLPFSKTNTGEYDKCCKRHLNESPAFLSQEFTQQKSVSMFNNWTPKKNKHPQRTFSTRPASI
jgi:hypothetical protein